MEEQKRRLLIEKLFHEALALDPGRRGAFLDSACASDRDLRAKVQRLLSMHEKTGDFPNSPAYEVGASLLGEHRASSLTGKSLGHYEILDCIGAGGMGVVYRARDTHLDRSVAIKVLPAEAVADPERKRRFVQEAKSASALNHPGIVTIHDISQSDGVDFIAMEYIAGKTLNQLIRRKGLPIAEVLKYAVQIADALAAAHAVGIVHRDLKPANIMVTEKGLVKVLDFGLAKLTESAQGSESGITQTMEPVTEEGTIVGTVAYMSPEQAEGKKVDARSDVFSFGSVLYEMVTGRRAFQGESTASTLSAILRDMPPPVRKLRGDVPTALEQIVRRCLEKNRETRYASATEIWKDLTSIQSQLATRRAGIGSILRRPRFAIPAIVLLVVIAVAFGWFWVRSSRNRWARTVALPEIARLANEQRGCAALRLMQRAEFYLKGDPEFERLRQNNTFPGISIRTDPDGADIYIRDYHDMSNSPEWLHLGRTPLESIVIPSSYFAFRITKPGFDDVEGTSSAVTADYPLYQTSLRAKGTSPPGMIWVPARRTSSPALWDTEPIRNLGFEGYWLDRYEVTNKQFKEFMDRGAYEKKEYWKYPFEQGGRTIHWNEAMARFRDATGRPGPATWEFGTYPPDQADYPVSGVSWYEAEAYAEFAGKSLPTVHHWASAAADNLHPDIMQVSNFAGKGPARVGSYRGLSPFGSYDMAGNVKEWCWNALGMNRYILGGAWSDQRYEFLFGNVRSPMDRTPVNGFRCAKYTKDLPKELTGPLQMLFADRRGDKPVGDAIFQVYKAIHQYERAALKSATESVEDNLPFWRLEKVSFQAGYGNERVTAYLHLPKNATPPYQTVVFFPSDLAREISSSSDPVARATGAFDFIIRSGRAVVFPIYKGTYERGGGSTESQVSPHKQPSAFREKAIDWSKDFGRSLDYLETRPEIDQEKMAYYGTSWGGSEGPRIIALEPRIKVGVLLWGGFGERGLPAETDSLNFAPRVRVPILMLNGRYDAIFPLETSQIPLFQLLGTPEKDKRHIVLDAGHAPLNQDVIKEVLSWLDRYLGPVRTR